MLFCFRAPSKVKRCIPAYSAVNINSTNERGILWRHLVNRCWQFQCSFSFFYGNVCDWRLSLTLCFGLQKSGIWCSLQTFRVVGMRFVHRWKFCIYELCDKVVFRRALRATLLLIFFRIVLFRAIRCRPLIVCFSWVSSTTNLGFYRAQEVKCWLRIVAVGDV